jgi:phage-related protein
MTSTNYEINPIYFYNRDRNITGAALLNSFEFNPNYGSSINFVCKTNKYMYNNNTYAMIPITLNNVVAECDFNFTVNENNAQQIINFFESQSGTGAFAINDSSQIYRPLTGFADNFSIQMLQNNLYGINLKFSVERNSSFLNWSGMSFLNYDFVPWQTGQFYQKYQPVYFEIQSESQFDNFFYAKEDHLSAFNNSPVDETIWTQEFFYENELGLPVDTKPKITKNEFKNSFAQRIKDNQNIHSIESLTLEYKNISDFQLKSMLHFIENKLGYRKFVFNLPKIYNRPKIFYADSWSHSWNYEDSNNFRVTLVEDPLGLKKISDSPMLILSQSRSSSNFSMQLAPQNEICVVSSSGENLLSTGDPINVNWSGWPLRNIKVYRPVSNLDCQDQDLSNVYFARTSKIDQINVNYNHITDISFNGARNISSLDAGHNLLTEFNCSGTTGLQNLNLEANLLTNINIDNCPFITGLNLRSNNINQSDFTQALEALAFGSGQSGLIAIDSDINFAIVNPTPQSGIDYKYIASIDYRNWTQLYKNLQLPIVPTGYINTAVFPIWLSNSFSGLTGAGSNGFWNSSFNNYSVVQNNSPFDSTWVKKQDYEIAARPTYSFNNSIMTGSGINNTGDYLSAFVVVKFGNIENPKDECILNFSPNKDYGLFYNGKTVSFRDGANDTFLIENARTQDYCSIGFIRNSTHFTGYLNGVVSRSGTLAVSNLNSIKLSVGGAEGSTPKYFGGNLGEVLVFSNNASFNLNSGFHKPFNARFGIFMP